MDRRNTSPGRRAFLAVALLFACVTGCADTPAAPPDPNAVVRQQFLDAMAAVTAVPTAPAPDSDALRAYVLFPYLQAARLQRQLQLVVPAASGLNDPLLPLDAEIQAFLAAQGERPVASRLRQDWLASLAARRAWAPFLAQYDPARDESALLRCHALAARTALGRNDGLKDALTEAWLTPRTLPDACNPAFEAWKAAGGLDASLVERRARLALGAGQPALARVLAKSLPADKAAPLAQWADLIERPAATVTRLIATPAMPVEDAALLDGWQRYARADADAAAAAFPALVEARKLDTRTASPYALATALALAWSRRPGALDFFQKVHPDDFDERAFEWQARAALWAGDWRRAAAAVASMPETLRQQPRWQYWSARAAEQLGDFGTARTLYGSILQTDNWYAVLASARLARKFSPTLQPLVFGDAEIGKLAAEPGFLRTRELLSCGLEPEASAEWRAAFDEATPDRQRLAVGLAARWGWHHQAIATAARQKLFNDYDLLYPRPYDFEVRGASSRTGLPAELIYAIIRQESLYRADAGSSAGAVGLMQLLPETARLVARRAGLPVPTRAQLTLPSVNVPLGSAYLASLLERFGGEPALAAAAYNAGPNAARRWQPPAPLDLDVWAENIPYNETRAYVQRVAWHTLVFAWLADREPRDVSGWLRSVKPLEDPAAGAPSS